MTDKERERLGHLIIKLVKENEEQANIIEALKDKNAELKRQTDVLNRLVSGTLYLPTCKLRPIYAD